MYNLRVRIPAGLWVILVGALVALAALAWPTTAQAPSRGSLFIVETELGSFTIQLNADAYPDSAREFVNRVDMGYYSGAVIARRPDGRLVQLGTQRLDGPAPQCSFTPEHGGDSLEAYSLAWALQRNSDAAGYAFFITLEDCLDLSGYTAFASVVAGQDVVENLRPGDAILNIREQYKRRGRP